MGKCVYFSYMHYGHIIPNLEMLKELSLRGEELICYSSSTYSHLFKGFDCEFREYDNLNEIYNMFCMGYPVNSFEQDDLLQRVLATSLFFAQTLDREKAITKYYSDLLREENIDYVIYDFASFWGKSIARELGVKSICCFEIPVFPTNIYDIDMKHFLSYFDFRYLLRDQIFLKPDRIDDDMASKLKIILDAYFTLMRIKGYDDFVSMHKSDFLNIVHIPKELQAYSEELDSTYKFIGYKPPKIDNTNTEKEKCIYISQGTVFTQKHIPFVEKSISAFRESPYKVVISLGMDNRIKDIEDHFTELPDNITIGKNINQIDVLSNCLLYITSGGISGMKEALSLGVPVLLVGMPDQTYGMLEKLNLGRIADKWTISENELFNLSVSIMNDKVIKSSCMRMSEVFLNTDGYVEGVNCILNACIQK